MADIYKMIAGTMIFVLFVASGLIMMAGTFPDLAPAGFDPNNLKKISEPVPPAVVTNCDPGFLGLGSIQCALASFFGPLINGLTGMWNLGTGLLTLMFGIFTFDVPAFSEMGPIGILFRLLIMIPMVLAIGLMLFFVIKSVIPTVGGNAE